MKKIVSFMAILSFVFVASCNKREDIMISFSEVVRVTQTTAVVNATVEGDGDILEKGVCYSIDNDPSINSQVVKALAYLDDFSCKITGLEPSTKYYVRVYVMTERTVYYGDILEFTTKNGESPDPEDEKPNILFVLNEGNYTYANASLTCYNIETGTVENNVFSRVNGSPIGDVGQSLAQNGDKLYIVVNNSNYIYKCDVNTLKYEALLADFNSPLHMKFVSDTKAYVTDLMAKGVWVINPENMTHTGFVQTGKPTQNMLLVGNKLYVTNWSNYYAQDVANNTIQVIDTETDQMSEEIVVGIEPNSLALDKNNNIWVMCGGGYEKNEKAKLFCISPSDNHIVKTFKFPDFCPTNYPSCLNIDNTGTILYYIDNGKVYRMSIYDEALPSQPFITGGMLLYNMCVNPGNGDIYVSDVKSYTVNGDVLCYSSEGKFLNSFQVGVTPGFMLFKK